MRLEQRIQNIFCRKNSQSVKNDLKTNDNIRKITTGQGDDYKTVCLLVILKNTIR